MNSNEPMLVERENWYMTLRQANLALRIAMTDAEDNVEKVRGVLGNWTESNRTLKDYENMDIIVIGDQRAKVLAAAFLPRIPSAGAGVFVGGKGFSRAFSAKFAKEVISAFVSLDGEEPSEALGERLKRRISEQAWRETTRAGNVDVGWD